MLENSAIPPDKEDLISIFVKKNATSSFSLPSSVQDNNKIIIIKDNISLVMFSFPAETKRSSLPTEWYEQKMLADKKEPTSAAFRSDLASNGEKELNKISTVNNQHMKIQMH